MVFYWLFSKELKKYEIFYENNKKIKHWSFIIFIVSASIDRLDPHVNLSLPYHMLPLYNICSNLSPVVLSTYVPR